MDCITNVHAKSLTKSLWRHPDFLKLWTGQTISELGSRITREGLPLTAVLVLGAQPAQMGFLAATGAASVLLFGLLAGVWADRIKRRPIMIASDLLRAALLVTIPAAAFAHRISMPQLYVVIALTGFCTVFFDVAYQSYLPSLVEREELLDGNSKLAQSNAIAEVAGPSLTGVLVQTITAPAAILFDALSFVISALSVWLIRKPEPASKPSPEHTHFLEETIAGLCFVFAQPVLKTTGVFFCLRLLLPGSDRPALCAVRDPGIASASGGAGRGDRRRRSGSHAGCDICAADWPSAGAWTNLHRRDWRVGLRPALNRAGARPAADGFVVSDCPATGRRLGVCDVQRA